MSVKVILYGSSALYPGFTIEYNFNKASRVFYYYNPSSIRVVVKNRLDFYGRI